jgi:hypothetical protein
MLTKSMGGTTLTAMTLQEYLSKNGLSCAAFGREVGLDASTIYRIATQQRLPSYEAAFVINHYTGGEVPIDSFLLMTPKKYHAAFLEADKRDEEGERLTKRRDVILDAVSKSPKAKRRVAA